MPRFDKAPVAMSGHHEVMQRSVGRAPLYDTVGPVDLTVSFPRDPVADCICFLPRIETSPWRSEGSEQMLEDLRSPFTAVGD